MLSKMLQQIIDQKLTNAREVGELAGVSTSTVYRWISGESQPDFDSIRLLVRHLRDPRAQEAILAVFAAGTSWQFSHTELELDVNHDGQVNTEDALDASVQAVKAAADSLVRVRHARRENGLTAEQTLELIALLNNVVRQCTITERVLVHMSEEKRKRKLKLAK
jgi:transcriptional regulator with XRE-family HTH domain